MNAISLEAALIIDLVVVACAFAFAVRRAKSFLHPLWMFLGVHGYTVTLRLIQLNRGAHPLRATFAWAVSEPEVIRAAILSDFGLIALVIGSVAAAALAKRNPPKGQIPPASNRRLVFAAVAAMVIGLVGIGVMGRVDHRLANAGWDSSGYLAATTTWPSWSVCLLHYVFGFRLPLLALTVLALAVVGMFNPTRFAVVIPILFLGFLWASRRSNRQSPWHMVPFAVLTVVVWLPMKPLMSQLATGASFADAFRFAVSTTFDEMGKQESSVDTQFLDMTGATMTLADLRGSPMWGSSIAPLVVSPVPRVLWPDKPKLNQYQWDLQIPSRNLADLGMTAGLIGEGYADGGYPGAILLCFGVGLVYSLAYFRIAGRSDRSASWLAYLFCLSSLMQVYRDGLVSTVWFPLVYAAPIGLTALSHWIWPPRLGEVRLRAASPRWHKVRVGAG